jgi:hypothetical protein
MALPCACPPYFKYGLQMVDFDTSLLNLDNLELAHIHFNVPEDVECLAEVEARGFAQDADGDYFESGDMVKKPALAQAEWIGEQKQYTVKALLPGDEGHGVLKVYAGKRGLMVRFPQLYPHSLDQTDISSSIPSNQTHMHLHLLCPSRIQARIRHIRSSRFIPPRTPNAMTSTSLSLNVLV